MIINKKTFSDKEEQNFFCIARLKKNYTSIVVEKIDLIGKRLNF